MEEKPRIKVPFTALDAALEAAGLLSIAFCVVIALLAWIQLPNTIPVKFDMSGGASSYGGKWTILLLGGVGVAIYIFFSVMAFYPHKYKFSAKITVKNAPRLYRLATSLLRAMKLEMALTFSGTVYMVYRGAIDNRLPLLVLLLCVILPVLAIVATNVLFAIRLSRAK